MKIGQCCVYSLFPLPSRGDKSINGGLIVVRACYDEEEQAKES